ncbi:MAG: response regulator transcription factor [Candidatus Phocaeicola faecipullorum]|nr:response regulator transcription factor [Candidatus Phocaeicola faecipullorum]
MKYKAPGVLLVDDHALILQGIKFIVDGMSGVGEVCTASSAAEAIALIKEKSFCVCLLDIELPDLSGFELLEIIRERCPGSRIIVNTMHEETWIVKKLLRMGVDGVILKSADTNEIRNALESVLRGEKYFCEGFNKIRKRLRFSINAPDYRSLLTNREIDVLKAIASGMQTKEIAERLHVSVNTVETHRKSLFMKFEVRNAVELVLKAINNGIIHLDPNKNI